MNPCTQNQPYGVYNPPGVSYTSSNPGVLSDIIPKVTLLFTSVIAGASWLGFIATGHPAPLLLAIAFTFLSFALPHNHLTSPHYHHIRQRSLPVFITTSTAQPRPVIQHVEVIRQEPIYIPVRETRARVSPHLYESVRRQEPINIHVSETRIRPSSPPFRPYSQSDQAERHNLVTGFGPTARAVIGGANREERQTDPESRLVSGYGPTARAIVGGANR